MRAAGAACMTVALLGFALVSSGYADKAPLRKVYAIAISSGPGLVLATTTRDLAGVPGDRHLVCRQVVDLVVARVGTSCAAAHAHAAFTPRSN